MNVKSTANALADERSARVALVTLKDALALKVDQHREAAEALRTALIETRPLGLLTVDEMAEAIGRDRNHVDSVWSTYGETVKGRQTRVPITDAENAPEMARNRYELLKTLNATQTSARDAEKTARAERDRTITMIYNSRILGPSAIAQEADIDRNHVLRIARRNGVGPVHRPGTKNQHTAK